MNLLTLRASFVRSFRAYMNNLLLDFSSVLVLKFIVHVEEQQGSVPNSVDNI